ncbi:hypothetical protein GRJ2_000866100 [Grus japonensis]|uniref:Uncharacterized protein n=1 Tax=Grus japonensis TaxID=30415 RepID=A0ABC9WET5_GRUJA
MGSFALSRRGRGAPGRWREVSVVSRASAIGKTAREGRVRVSEYILVALRPPGCCFSDPSRQKLSSKENQS